MRRLLLHLVGWSALMLHVCTCTMQAQSITVTNLNDSGPGSLREAVNVAIAGTDIYFDSSLVGTVNLLSPITIDSALTIEGPSPHVIKLDGGGLSRVFVVNGQSFVVINGLTIQNGAVIGNGGGIYIPTRGRVRMNNVVVSGCYATGNGGGAYANGDGGEIFAQNSTFTGCTADNKGGAICADSIQMLFMLNSTLSANTALTGGAIYSLDTENSFIRNSTVSGNSATTAHAVYFANFNAIATPFNWFAGSTIANNGAGGAAIVVNDAVTKTVTRFNHSIYSNVVNFAKIGTPTLTSSNFNLSSDGSMVAFLTGGSDVNNTAANLEPLDGNGGFTRTHALLPGSPAINTAPGHPGTTDQRAYKRNGVADKGAFEYLGIPPDTTIIINEVDSDTPGADVNEFIELYDGGNKFKSLNGLVLALCFGATDQVYYVIDLDNYVTDRNGYFVIGNAAVPGVDLIVPNGTILNGADAVALYYGNADEYPVGSAVTTTKIVDAIVYDTDDPDDLGLLTLLKPGQPQVNENSQLGVQIHSMQRIQNGQGGLRNTVTYVPVPPTPAAKNICPGHDPGLDATTTICDSELAFNLMDALWGTPDTGGTWLDDDLTGGLTDSLLNATGLDSTYEFTYYIVGRGGCPDASATVTVNVFDRLFPGQDSSSFVCELDSAVDLMTRLAGFPASGGAWNDVDLSGQLTGSFFDARGLPEVQYHFSYTIAVGGGCPDTTATITIGIDSIPDPGLDTTIAICEVGALLNLNNYLSATAELGGTWSDDSLSGQLVDSNVTLLGLGGQAWGFGYSVARGVCPNGTSSVLLDVTNFLDPGLDTVLDACESSIALDLFSELAGTPDPAGLWTDDDITGQLTGSILNAAGLAGGNFNFTYHHSPGGACPDTNTTILVTVYALPDAGKDSSISICESDTAFNLKSAIGGTPLPGGLWNDDFVTGQLTDSIFNPAGLGGATYDFTYTVSGGVCGDSSATVSVTVTAIASPGLDSSVSVCVSETAINLDLKMGGFPALGGVWNDDDVTGQLTGNLFDASSLAGGSYNFTYQHSIGGGCPDTSATVTVDVFALPDGGKDSSVAICESESSFDLNTGIGGTPDGGGAWNDDHLTGQLVGNIFDASGLGGGTYDFTYTVSGGVCADSSSTVSVTVTTIASPGIDSAVFVCVSNNMIDLDTKLGGIPSAAGTWNDDDLTGQLAGNIFDAAGLAGASYNFTYEVSIGGGCPDTTATVNVTVDALVNGGQDSSIIICESETAYDLTNDLAGSPDAGGTWNDDDLTGQLVGSIFDASGLAGGIFDFTYTVPGGVCADSSATVSVTVTAIASPGLDTAVSLCVAETAFNLDINLGGFADVGGVWYDDDVTGQLTGNLFDASGLAGGSYDFSYQQSIGGGCPDTSATISISVIALPDGGRDSAISICESETAFDLNGNLAGTPAGGGNWNDDDLTGQLTLNLFDATTLGGFSYDFTYTVAGAVCPDSSATVSVFVTLISSPGLDTTVSVCVSDNAVNLDAKLGGWAAAGGSWSDDDLTGQLAGNIFNATGLGGASYNFSYQHAIGGGCPDTSATVTINIDNIPDGGLDSTVFICEDQPAFNLSGGLGGTPNIGGSWNDDDATGQLIAGILNASNLGGGNYDFTYTVNGASCPDSSATVTVFVTGDINPGKDSTLLSCSAETALDITNGLGGTHDIGGTWSDHDNTSQLTDSILDCTGLAGSSFDFYYVLAGSGACTADSALVTVTVLSSPNPGISGTLNRCEQNTNINLNNGLGGSPDGGGTWNDDDLTGQLSSNIFNSTNLGGGSYNFTYTVTAAGCPDSSAIVTVVVTSFQSPGQDSSVLVCEVESAVNLKTKMGGFSSLGGFWTDDDATGQLTGSVFDATGLAGGTYDFSYTMSVGGGCPDSTATVAVSVTALPNGGRDSAVSICESNATFNLNSGLGGFPDGGGFWTDDDATGALTGSMFNAIGFAGGTYHFSYTASTITCPDSTATVTVFVTPITLPGADTSGTVCEVESAVNLFTKLGGTWDAGGSWSDDDLTGQLIGNTFDATGLAGGSYDFSYTHSIGGGCPDSSATVTINVTPLPDGGNDSAITVCESDTAIGLFAALAGSPDAGGSWNDDDATGALTAGVFNAMGFAGGSYNFTYTVSSTVCPDSSATVTVNVTPITDPGSDSTSTVCESETSIDLNLRLGGSAQIGGTWNDDDATLQLAGNLFDATGLAGGTYHFTYTHLAAGGCADTSAIVTMNIMGLPNGGQDSSVTICESNTAFDVSSGLGGFPDGGGTWNDDDATGALIGSLFNATALGGGSYHFTYSTSTFSCPDSSATVTVNVTSIASPGLDTSVTVCEWNNSVNLDQRLGGYPTGGGTWNDDNTTGQLAGNIFDASGLAGSIYNFTYTVSIGGGCPDTSSTVSVSVASTANGGRDSTISICESEFAFTIATGLGGFPDGGGTWNDDDLTGALTVNLFNANGLAGSGYDFTYTATAAGCPDSSATVTVNVTQKANPGADSSVVACESESALDLNSLIGGFGAAGGTWNDDDLTGQLSGNLVDGNGLGGGAYGFTYTHSVGGGCPDSSATVTIFFTIQADAGRDSAVSVCESDTAFNLASAIGGTHDYGGTWADDDLTGALMDSTFNATMVSSGTYHFSYSVLSLGCPDSTATITVNVTGIANPGQDSSVQVCVTESGINMNTLLGGFADAGGAWTDDDATGQLAGNILDATGLALSTYHFTYTQSIGGGCQDTSATVTVLVVARPDGGRDTTVIVCELQTAVNLNSKIAGSPQGGGTWNDDDLTGQLVGSIFNANGLGGSSYNFTYNVDGGVCADSSATVTIIVGPSMNAGKDSSFLVCQAENALNLNNSLSAAAQQGGTWRDFDATGQLTDSILNCNGLQGFNYDFYYAIYSAGPCPSDSAKINVAVVSPDPGIPDTLYTCETNTYLDVQTGLGGTPDVGGSWNDDDLTTQLSGQIFDASNMGPGIYHFTYEVSSIGCPDSSSTVVVDVAHAPRAGRDTVWALCDGERLINLQQYLTPDADSGGVWNDDDNTGQLYNQYLDPYGLAGSFYDFTYLQATHPLCAPMSATINVYIDNAVNGGRDSTVTICESSTAFNLNNGVGGTPNGGGTWADDDATGRLSGVFFNAFGMGGDTYDFSYTVIGGIGCPDSTATVSITVDKIVNPGGDNTQNICDADRAYNLFDMVLAGPDRGGVWRDVDGTGQLTDSLLDGDGLGGGTYEFHYVLDGGTCPFDSSTMLVTVIRMPNPGNSGSILACEINSGINLNTGLSGSPNSGGVWSDIDNTGALTGNLFNGTGFGGNSYTFMYTVSATACPDSSSFVTVNVSNQLDAGNNNDTTVCLEEQFSLAPVLGVHDYGGTWKDIDFSSAISDSIFLGAPVGVYRYTYTVVSPAPCSPNSATVTVYVEDCTGIDEEEDASSFIKVFPNPNRGVFELSIEREDLFQSKIQIQSVSGQIVWQEEITRNNNTFSRKIDLTQYSAGIYYLKLTTNEAVYVIPISKN